MTVDWASLTNDALGLRAFAYVPGRARLEGTGSAAAREVAIGVGVFVGEAGHLGDDVVHGHLLLRVRACRKRQ